MATYYERETPSGTFTLEVVQYDGSGVDEGGRFGLQGTGPQGDFIEPSKYNYATEEQAEDALDSMAEDWDSFADALDEEADEE